MNIPENANGVADLLDEARWQMEFHLRMQVPQGQALAGMAHHKMHDANWTGFPMRPDQDPQQRFLRPPSTAATLNLAATAAQCARIWQSIDPSFAARCLTAAQRAWGAARAHPNLLAPGSDSTGGGSYGDGTVSDEFFWAAAELFITTGDATYQTFLTQSPFFNQDITGMHWGGTQALGAISLAVVPNGLGPAGIASVRNHVVAGARAARTTVQNQGYGVPITNYPWGSSSSVLNAAILMALAYDFTGDQGYLQAVVQSMDYILGRNALGKSYVSGYGENPLRNPHHRFWARQVSASFPPPPRGALSGGPNASPSDPTARAALGGCRPQRCYIDDLNAYSVNEVAINWNAPLAWVAAFLDEKGGN
jgi:endoglucanase